MKREFIEHDIEFYIRNYTARHNEFENELKYQLFIKEYESNNSFYRSTGYKFSRIKDAKNFVKENIAIWL